MALTREGGQPARFAEPSDVHQSVGLTRVSLDYPAVGHIADIVAPRVRVSKPQYTYYEFDKGRHKAENSSTIAGIKRADLAQYARDSFDIESATGETEEYGLEIPISWKARDVSDDAVDLDVASTERATARVLNEREQRVAALLTSTSTMTNYTTLSGTDQWDQAGETANDPADDVDDARRSVHLKIGVEPNVLVLGKQVYDVMKRHSAIRSEYKYTAPGMSTADVLADYFGVERVVVAGALYNSANEGQTADNAYIWGKHAILLYIPPNPAPLTPACIYQFVYEDMVTERYSETSLRQDIVRVREDVDEKVVDADAGYLLDAVIS